MSARLRVHPLFMIVCLLLWGTVVVAQDAGRPRARPTDDHHAEHAADGYYADDASPLHDVRPQESFVGWMLRCMGLVGFLIPFAGVFCFALTLVVVMRCHGPFALAALVFIVPIPFLLGLFGTLQGMILSLQVIATSSVMPKPSEISDGIATSLFTPMLGLVFMTPSYLAAILGSVIRSSAKPTVATLD